jgi:hypothetical protein
MATESPVSSGPQQGFFAKQAVEIYFRENYPKLQLPQGAIEQLSWSLRDPKQEDFSSPEARASDDKRLFDIKRMALRAESIRLLGSNDKSVFDEFVKLHPALTPAIFEKLSNEFKQLSENLRFAISISCLLVTSVYAKKYLNDKGITHFEDSELFLSHITTDGLINLLPLLQPLSTDIKNFIQSMYPRNTHFRHMLFVEGAKNMTKCFQALEGAKREEAFVPWRWRWIADTLGFGIQDATKTILVDNFLTPNTYENIEATFVLIRKDPKNFLDARLALYAKQARLDTSRLKVEEAQSLARMIGMYIGKFGQVTSEIVEAMLVAYNKMASAEREILIKVHQNFCNDPDAVPPTYVPGLMHSFYLKSNKNIEDTTLFMFQVLKGLYTLPADKKMRSCQKLASNVNGCLDIAIGQWRENKQLDFALDSSNEIIVLAKQARSNISNITK